MKQKQNVLEEMVANIYDHNPKEIKQSLHKLYKNTHLIGAQDDNYEWCLVVTRKGEIKIYEQLKFAYEFKGCSEILDYEYEILGQEYVNILDVQNYTKDILDRLEELGATQHFIDWYNKQESKQFNDTSALRFQTSEYLLFLLGVPPTFRKFCTLSKIRHEKSQIPVR